MFFAVAFSCSFRVGRPGCTGVGAIASSVVTTRLLMTLNHDRLLFVGTCGSYSKSRLLVGDFLIVSYAVSTSLDILEDRSYRPSSESYKWVATMPIPVPFPALSVAVTPGVTRTYDGAELLSSVAAVEHLELTGVFAACHEAKIPCGAVLVVANYVGPDAHLQWQANHALVSRNLISTLKNNGIFDVL